MTTTHEGKDARRAVHPSDVPGARVEQGDGRMWRLRSLAAAREALRARQATTQAGFTAEYVPLTATEQRPVLFSDGPDHDEQRAQVARFFAPAVVKKRYRAEIEAAADRKLDEAYRAGTFLLDDLALHFTVEVTAEIVGLTRSHATQAERDRAIRRMSRRLVAFFHQPPFDLSKPRLGRSRKQWAQAAWHGLRSTYSFYLLDVRPALRERGRHPREDVMTHLLKQGMPNKNILVEAMTYGTAGMVTTREFIVMAAWHLLTTPDLAARYRAGDDDERLAILYEIIRLEPVVGHLYRRATEPVTLTDGDTTHTVAAGDLIDVDVRAANADAAVLDQPRGVCPHREMPTGVRAAGLTFGDGPHKCPGESLAMLETDILLSRLMAREPELQREPTVGWDELVAGYELRGLRLRLGK